MSVHKVLVDSRLLAYTEPDYDGSQYVQWKRAVYDAFEHTDLCCSVCWARPSPGGEREHGRGCYVLDEDGGGFDDFDVDEILAAIGGTNG